MFSVTTLYDIKQFLELLLSSKVSEVEFKHHFKFFRYSIAQKVLEVVFKCGWCKLTKENIFEITDKGRLIAESELNLSLRFQLQDLISNYNPVWAAVLQKGRSEARNFLPDDVMQCFREADLFGALNEDIIKFWDDLALAYRNISHKQKLETGRRGEQLSVDFEAKRTRSKPVWQSIESNLSGFDILSIVDDKQQEPLKIEVKASVNNIKYSKIHITRNEWQTAKASNYYVFHIWDISSSPKLYIKNVDEMEFHIPSNNGVGEWETVEIPMCYIATTVDYVLS